MATQPSNTSISRSASLESLAKTMHPVITNIDEHLLPVYRLIQQIAVPVLRISLGVIFFWIGALKFSDPRPVVGMLSMSLSFLAKNSFVYGLGTLEIIAAILLILCIGIRYVGLMTLVLFLGTLTIFLIAPKITYGPGHFPALSLAGQFLLKDLALAATSLMLIALDTTGKTPAQKAPVKR